MNELSGARPHRILFVDDDPLVLRALSRELRAYSDRWENTFAEGGQRALVLLGQSSYDILVTDMVMPGIDGAALLHYAREHHPGMTRIVLSGHAEMEQALRSVPFAHQRLLKPWSRDELTRTLDRASTLHAVIGDDLIRRCISHVGSLPSSQAAYLQLSRALDSPHASFASIAQVIESDMAMSAKLLQLANSAFVGTTRAITQIIDAVRAVGLQAIRQYLLSPYLNVFELFATVPKDSDARFSSLGDHALLTAHLSAALVGDEQLRNVAFVTGLVHDIGSLVLMARMPDVSREMAREAEEKDCAVEELERRRFGITHAEIGAYLLGLWGLPSTICDAVSRHHESGAPDGDKLVLAVRLANWLAREHEARKAKGVNDPSLLVLDRDDALLRVTGHERNIGGLLALAAERAASLHS